MAPLGLLFCLWLLATRTFTQAWILAALVVAGLPLLWWARTTPDRAEPRGPDRLFLTTVRR